MGDKESLGLGLGVCLCLLGFCIYFFKICILPAYSFSFQVNDVYVLPESSEVFSFEYVLLVLTLNI